MRLSLKFLAASGALILTFAAAGAQTTALAQTLASPQTRVHEPDPNELAETPSTWRGAVADSLRLLMMEHSTRIAFQSKTRRELGGPFMRDYLRSVKIPDTWADGDSWGINYVGHPIHGAASGFIWLDHEDGSHDPKLGFSKEFGQAEVVRLPGRHVTAFSSSSVCSARRRSVTSVSARTPPAG
jgi:hypothetical protein